jgi:hypothetical protein
MEHCVRPHLSGELRPTAQGLVDAYPDFDRRT